MLIEIFLVFIQYLLDFFPSQYNNCRLRREKIPTNNKLIPKTSLSSHLPLKKRES